MTPGQVARRIFGQHFDKIGSAYRRIFVDLQRIVPVFERELRQNAKVLDIGGGDGAFVELLLQSRPDLEITMCDLAPEIGSFLSEENRAKVKLLPATEFQNVEGRFDVISLSDVIHHIPVADRSHFFENLAKYRAKCGAQKLVLKDVEPGGWRANLSVLSDRYVTGDKHVVLFSRKAFADVAKSYFPDAERKSEMPDMPNYCEVLSW